MARKKSSVIQPSMPADGTSVAERPKVMVSIVERGKGTALMNLYNKEGVEFHYQTIGHGTATSEIMDILGLDSKEKDVIISFAAESMIDHLIYRMSDALRGAVNTKGILFDVPVTGITNRIAAALNIRMTAPGEKRTPIEMDRKEESEKMSSENAYSLILISVNQGYTENVLDTARALGARGGTILRARWSGDKHFEQHHGMTLQSEKEVIAIVVANDIRNMIMDTVNAEYGLQSDAQAVVCSMKVDHFAPI